MLCSCGAEYEVWEENGGYIIRCTNFKKHKEAFEKRHGRKIANP